MKCDIIANGVVDAAKELGIESSTCSFVLKEPTWPSVKKFLLSLGLKITAANDLADAAQKAVAAAKGA
jgi:succinyl-CoA synthetase beta subunit